MLAHKQTWAGLVATLLAHATGVKFQGEIMPTDEELHKISIEFFHIFSRVEYSLKAVGFHHGEGQAQANWDAFADEVSNLIDNPNNEELAAAIEFILGEPPKKQVILNGVIDWDEARPNNPITSRNLFVYLRRVRNNLFHGGKFNGHWFAPERSEQLINSSIAVLKHCVAYVGSVNEAYHG